MSEPGLESELLTREEMDALVGALAEERVEHERHERAAGRARSEPRRAMRGRVGGAPALAATLESFATRRGRSLSLAHQRRIGASLISCSELRAHELAEVLLPVERLVAFALRPDEPAGYLVFGRPYFFTLLALACGARPGAPLPPVPKRPYSRIEERFLLRFADEALGDLAASFTPPLEARPRVLGVEGLAHLRERDGENLLIASIDVVGLGDVGRLRVVLPHAPAASASTATEAPRAQGPIAAPREAFGRLILEMSVALQVEIGSAEVPLARVAALQPGDVIPLRSADASGLVVRIEGAPKFRAQPGALGRVLAVEVTDRL